MSKAQKLFLFFAVAAALAGLLQTSGALRLWGMVPNWTLVVLSVAAFFIDSFLSFLLLLVITSVFLRFEGGLNFSLLIVLAVFLLLYWVRGRILLPGLPTTLALIAAGTIVLYLLFDPRFLIQFPRIVFWELIYNGIIGIGLFWLAKYLHETRT